MISILSLKKNILPVLIVFLLVCVFFTLPTKIKAQGVDEKATNYKAKIIKINDAGETISDEGNFHYQKLELSITSGDKKGQTIQITNDEKQMSRYQNYKTGDEVMATLYKNEGGDEWIVADYVRQGSLLRLTAIFIVLVVVVGRIWGITSLLSMILSLGVVFKIFLPLLIKGYDPILVTLGCALIIIPVTFYLSHGWNLKTHIAVGGTMICLTIAGLLAIYTVNDTKLSGTSSEEAMFLAITRGGNINLKSLLLAGMLLSTLGMLDDMTVALAGFVFELQEINPKFTPWQLFNKAMALGQDHISSMVNTLVLVYAGSALPLLLLFVDSQRPLWEVLNYEMIAEEIVRTLVGSIILITSAPITALMASFLARHKKKTGKILAHAK